MSRSAPATAAAEPTLTLDRMRGAAERLIATHGPDARVVIHAGNGRYRALKPSEIGVLPDGIKR